MAKREQLTDCTKTPLKAQNISCNTYMVATFSAPARGEKVNTATHILGNREGSSGRVLLLAPCLSSFSYMSPRPLIKPAPWVQRPQKKVSELGKHIVPC